MPLIDKSNREVPSNGSYILDSSFLVNLVDILIVTRQLFAATKACIA